VEQSATIAAIATPPGGGLRGVIRISGPDAIAIAQRACELENAEWGRRSLARGRLRDARGSQPVLVLAMPAPHSFTREDVVELHLPGSPPLLAAALARVVELGAQPAQPGEFTRRAFENGRIDLARAEGVVDLIEAANEDERRAATALLFGGLSSRVEALRRQLVELRALCEASLDFDEADAGHVPTDELRSLARAAGDALSEALSWEVRRARTRSSPRVVLVGAPNAGKSSLFNTLCAERNTLCAERNALCSDRALVSDSPGTTRDSVAGTWRTGELECTLIDTAGLDDAALAARGDDPDKSAQEFARSDHASADLLLHVVDARRADTQALLAEHEALPRGPARVLAWSQIDRPDSAQRPPDPLIELAGPRAWTAVSSRARTGLAELASLVAGSLGQSARARARGSVRELSQRHHDALAAAATDLEHARAALEAGEPLDLVAESLRAATDALDSISGRTTPDDVLDVVFARFCIGK
jgi:tRNA modification GTPase